MSIATVRHITRDHVRITPAKGYSVTVFNMTGFGSDLEAMVTADDGSETIRLLVDAPGPRHLAISMTDEFVDLVYSDRPNLNEGPKS